LDRGNPKPQGGFIGRPREGGTRLSSNGRVAGCCPDGNFHRYALYRAKRGWVRAEPEGGRLGIVPAWRTGKGGCLVEENERTHHFAPALKEGCAAKNHSREKRTGSRIRTKKKRRFNDKLNKTIRIKERE